MNGTSTVSLFRIYSFCEVPQMLGENLTGKTVHEKYS